MVAARGTVLDDRYGRTPARRRRGRIALVGGAAAGVAALLAWGLWTGIGGASTALEVDTLGVSVGGDDATTVRWLVTGRADTTLICAVEARDARGSVVGLVEETLRPTGRPDRTGTTVVRTVRLAATGLIASCRDA